MKKFNAYLYLFLGMLAAFTLGGYTILTFNNIQVIEPYRWVITSFVTLTMTILAVDKIRKL